MIWWNFRSKFISAFSGQPECGLAGIQNSEFPVAFFGFSRGYATPSSRRSQFLWGILRENGTNAMALQML